MNEKTIAIEVTERQLDHIELSICYSIESLTKWMQGAREQSEVLEQDPYAMCDPMKRQIERYYGVLATLREARKAK